MESPGTINKFLIFYISSSRTSPWNKKVKSFFWSYLTQSIKNSKIYSSWADLAHSKNIEKFFKSIQNYFYIFILKTVEWLKEISQSLFLKFQNIFLYPTSHWFSSSGPFATTFSVQKDFRIDHEHIVTFCLFLLQEDLGT